MVQHMNYDQLHARFDELAQRERDHLGKLDQTIFAMGDLLNEANPDDEELERLGKEWGYALATLQQRRDIARNIKPGERHPELSFTAHAAAAALRNREERNKLIQQGGRERWTAQDMTSAVRQKRQELGETRKPKPSPYIRQLNFSGGFDISDGHSTIKVRGTVVNGKVTLIVDSDHPRVDEVLVESIQRDMKQLFEFTVGDE
jgi:hypothetical protein